MMKTREDLNAALNDYRIARDNLHDAVAQEAPSMVQGIARSRHAKACNKLAETVDQLALVDKL